MNKPKAYRHGEIMFVKTDTIPELEEAKTDTIITGSSNNPHTFKGGKLYFKEKDWTIGYLKAENTTLYHVEHGKGKGKVKEAKLPDGNYEIRRAKETINKELVPVID